MKIEETLDTAKSTVLNLRDQQYGNVTRHQQHERIAQVWSGILQHEVTGYQVALCMAGMKLIRAENAPAVTDSFVDICGYAAIAGEIADIITGADQPQPETTVLQYGDVSPHLCNECDRDIPAGDPIAIRRFKGERVTLHPECVVKR